MLSGEFENFFERGNALSGEFAAKPGAGVEAAEFGQRQIVDSAATVGGAIYGVVVNGAESRVTGELEIGLDESGTERDGATERGESVFGRVARSSSMCYHEHDYASSRFSLRATTFGQAVLRIRNGRLVTTGHLKAC